jgi:hypothetical protein
LIGARLFGQRIRPLVLLPHPPVIATPQQQNDSTEKRDKAWNPDQTTDHPGSPRVAHHQRSHTAQDVDVGERFVDRARQAPLGPLHAGDPTPMQSRRKHGRPGQGG